MNQRICPFCSSGGAVYSVGLNDDRVGCHNCGFRVAVEKWDELHNRLDRQAARIRELEEVMPVPGFLRFVSQVALCRDVLNSSDAKRLKDMADNIETALNRK